MKALGRLCRIAETKPEVKISKQPMGLDLVDFQCDYTKSAEENLQIYRERYREVFGEYPPAPTCDNSTDKD